MNQQSINTIDLRTMFLPVQKSLIQFKNSILF